MNREDEDPLLQSSTSNTTSTPSPAPDEGTAGVGCCGRVCRAVRGVTVEPVLFLYVFAGIMSSTITTNLLLDKVCREMLYPQQVCDNLTEHSSVETVVQQQVTTTLMYFNLITSLPSVFFALFLGSWSDRHGRKLPMVLPLVGNLMASVVYVINAQMITLPSSYILFAGLPIALTGSMSTLLMACFSYVSDISKLRARTTRVALVDLGFTLGSPIGLLLGDLLYYYVGYLGIYWTSAGLYFLAMTYTIVRIKDTKGPTAHPGVVSPERGISMCQDLFDTENVRRSFATAFRRRPDKGRAKVLLLIVAMCLMVMEFGGIGMDYLYTKKKFGWTYNQYVELSVTRLLLQLVVSSVVLPVLSYYLQVGDTVLVLVGCVSRILSLIIIGLADQPWLLYLSSVISCIGVFPLVISRSLISKVVSGEELGRIFSVLASCEAVIPLASGPLYTVVYNTTLETFPGTIFFLSASLYTLTGAIFVWVFVNRHVAAPSVPPITHTYADEIPEIQT